MTGAGVTSRRYLIGEGGLLPDIPAECPELRGAAAPAGPGQVVEDQPARTGQEALMRGSRPAVEGLLPQPDFGPRAQGGPSAPGRMNIPALGPLTASTKD